jgi:iron complex outermembrane receptor protein
LRARIPARTGGRAHRDAAFDSDLRGRRPDVLFEMMIMTFPALHLPALTPRILAAAIGVCCSSAFAQSTILAPVVVTGARFASDPALLPIGSTVISADDIRQSGVGDVNSAIRKIGGVYARQSLNGSTDFDLDLRGFGTNSSQNLVVVLDGVRLSENELSGAVLSTIAIDNVERIDITRGGSSVLYGEGATGGVINIITKRPTKQSLRGTVFGEVGQFGLREGRASIAQAWDGFALDAAIGALSTDNDRANNKFEQKTLNAGAQWSSKEGRIGLRIDSSRQDSRFPGPLTQAQFAADAHQTRTPGNFGSFDSDRVTGFIERRVGDFDLAAELSHREKTVKSLYVFSSGPSAAQYSSEQTQFSPRARHLGKFDGWLNEVVVGIDLTRWNRVTESAYSQADASQSAKAIYVRDEIKFDGPRNARVALGARHETFDKDSIDPALYTAATYSTKQSMNAWQLQGSFDAVPLVNLYVKAGQSYRVANADENAMTPFANKPLQSQTSHDLELGVTVGDAAQKLTARVFRHKLNNEIFYDPTAGLYGANTNLDPTKRQGIEIDASLRIAADWRLSGQVQHVQARFTDGPNEGRDMVLVPKNIVTARLSWLPGDGQSADFGAQWVDKQRNGNDFDNSCTALMPAFTTFDARYAKKFGAWEVALSGLNLADKRYYSQAFGCQSGIYPGAGRQMKVSARYDF